MRPDSQILFFNSHGYLFQMIEKSASGPQFFAVGLPGSDGLRRKSTVMWVLELHLSVNYKPVMILCVTVKYCF